MPSSAPIASKNDKPSKLRKAWRATRLTCLVLSAPFMLAAAVYVVPAEYIPSEIVGVQKDTVNNYKVGVSNFLLGTQKSRGPK